MEIPPVTSKKRKVSSTTSSNELGSNHRRRLKAVENQCFSPSLDHASTSSCSSSGSDERIELADLEDESGSIVVEVEPSICYSGRERKRETTSSSQVEEDSTSENLESSTERPASEVNSHRRSKKEKMPTESELEEFFGEAEKNLQKKFANKYNYDVVKDKPLEGRYEWLELKP